jgi:hypothetical protein
LSISDQEFSLEKRETPAGLGFRWNTILGHEMVCLENDLWFILKFEMVSIEIFPWLIGFMLNDFFFFFWWKQKWKPRTLIRLKFFFRFCCHLSCIITHELTQISFMINTWYLFLYCLIWEWFING